MGKPIETIIYLTNYVGPRIAAARDMRTYSEAGNRRVERIAEILRTAGYAVRLVSAGWKRADNRCRWYGAAEEEVASGLNCTYVPYFDLVPLNALVCIMAMIRLLIGLRIRAGRCAVVFYNPTLQTAPPALFARWFLGLPIYLQLEDGTHLIPSIGRLRGLSYRFLLWLARPFIAGAVVPSSLLADIHPGGNTLLYRGGFAPAAPAEWDPQSGERLTFLFAGALDEIRGVDLLLDALDRLDAAGELAGASVQFLITGTGPLEEEVRRRCALYQTLDVHYLGFLDREDYHATLARAHVGLALQKHDHPFSRACFPSKVMELMCAGKLVITSTVSDIASLPEGVCLRYARDDPAQIAALVATVCRTPVQCISMASKAYQWLREQFSPEATVSTFRQLFE